MYLDAQFNGSAQRPPRSFNFIYRNRAPSDSNAVARDEEPNFNGGAAVRSRRQRSLILTSGERDGRNNQAT